MNSAAVADYLVDWLKKKVQEAGKSGLVFGVSGGVDSAVVALLAKKAFPFNCMALLLPCQGDLSDLLHAQALVEEFNIRYRIVDLANAYNLIVTQFESYLKLEGYRGQLMKANLKPRLRMMALYYWAQAWDYLVVGTSNRSEMEVGYNTKFGDNAVDIQPLGQLLKREVYELAGYLQVPRIIMEKPPSGGLWSGQTDEEEMGVTYEQLDNFIAKGEGEPEIIAKVEKMKKASEHKKRMPQIATIPEELL